MKNINTYRKEYWTTLGEIQIHIFSNIAEAILIKEMKPTLNKQDNSVKLFN